MLCHKVFARRVHLRALGRNLGFSSAPKHSPSWRSAAIFGQRQGCCASPGGGVLSDTMSSFRDFSSAARTKPVDPWQRNLNDVDLDSEENYDDFEPPSKSSTAPQGYAKWLPIIATQGPKVALAIGGTYILSKSFMFASTYVMGISLSKAVWFGLVSGTTMTTVVGATAFMYYQTFQNVRPEPVYKKALEIISKNEDILKILGPDGFMGQLNSGLFKAYKLDGGNWGLGPGYRGVAFPTGLGDDKKLVFRWPRIQMNFQLYGVEKQAMCTVEAINHRGTIKFNLIMLNILNDPDYTEPILIHGNEDRIYIRDQLSGYISFKKSYVDQTEK